MKRGILLLMLIIVSCKNESSESSRLAILISKDSEIKHEEYFNGNSKKKLLNIQSITKSIISLLIGIAIEDGLIANENVTISKYFPELAPGNKSITIKHLLNHTSGIEWNGYVEHEEFLKAENQTNYVLGKKNIHQVGLEYNYNSGGTHLLSAILTQVSGRSTLEYAQEKLFIPLSINEFNWKKLNDGIYGGAGFSLEMLPNDLIKIGSLFLEGQGESSLVSKEWIDKSRNENLKKKTKWGLRNSKHGYGWYSSTVNKEKVIYSMGYGVQFILILPDSEMIIVTAHNHETPKGIEQQVDFLRETLPKLIEKYGS